MANGDQIDEKRGHKIGSWSKSYKLLDAVGATSNGKWIDTSLFPRCSVHVKGTFTATIKIMGSNDEAPADNVDGPQIGADITTEGLVSFELPCRWVKAKVTAYSSGSINANLHCLSP